MPFTAAVRTAFGGVEEAGRVPALGRDLRDALAHRARAEDGHVQRLPHGLLFRVRAHAMLLCFVASRRASIVEEPWRGFSWSTTARARARSSVSAFARRATTSRRSRTPRRPRRWRSSKPPDAVVTDLWMPGISGLQLCRLLRAEPATAARAGRAAHGLGRSPLALLGASRRRDRVRHEDGDRSPDRRARRSHLVAEDAAAARAHAAGRHARQRPGAALAAARCVALRVDDRRRGPRALAEGRGARAALRGPRARSPPTSPATAGSRSRPTARLRRTSSTRRGSSSTRIPI